MHKGKACMHYLFFRNMVLNSRQTTVYMNPAKTVTEYTTSNPMPLVCNLILAAPSYGTPPMYVIIVKNEIIHVCVCYTWPD